MEGKKVSQQFFDDIVQENVGEFEMTLPDALEDAINQLKEQKQDFSEVITTEQGYEVKKEIIEQMKELNNVIYKLKATDDDRDKDVDTTICKQDKVPVTSASVDVTTEAEAEMIIQKLNSAVDGKKAYAIVAASEGAIGATVYLVNRGVSAVIVEGASTLSSIHAKLSTYLSFLRSLCCCVKTREAIPSQGFGVCSRLVDTLIDGMEESRNLQNIDLLRQVYHLLSCCISKSEQNKRALKAAGIDQCTLHALRYCAEQDPSSMEDSRQRSAFMNLEQAVLQFLRGYTNDDDRRPGVHPNTFVRARKLCENKSTSILLPLLTLLEQTLLCAGRESEVDFLSQSNNKENVDSLTCSMNSIDLGEEATQAKKCKETNSELIESLICSLLATLKALAANDTICNLVFSHQGVDLVSKTLEGYQANAKIFKLSVSVLRMLARNDTIKSRLGNQAKSMILALVFANVERYLKQESVTLTSLQLLSTLSLRQPANCDILYDLGSLHVIALAMTKHQSNWKIQVEAMHLIRNMVSSYQNKHLIPKIIEDGVDGLIRQARSKHAPCEEPAFAALRELGLPYHN